ncbi:SLAM family member 5-like isoform X2 [Cebidichthys violaceus]|uniref:SLAM family member 5-like isoform X2 n=1 Tax=Cebidichthys violaceus TaxID=271503 RepID=UPI0035C94463
MAAGQLRYSSFFTYTALLLVGYSLYDVEASSCEHNIHKKVGDTVELSSCLPAEGVTVAQWKHGEFIIIDKDVNVSREHQFKGRLELNPASFNLTVRGLTVQDSGDFSFISEANEVQRPTTTITLQVHVPITVEPAVTSNSTWFAVNESCTVLLECSGATDSSVTYSWAVRNQTISGSGLRYSITPQDGDIEFTCTISNVVSEKSTMEIVTCSNVTSETLKTVSYSSLVLWVIGPVIGIVLFILLLLFYGKSKGLCCNRFTRSQTVNQDESQQPVYSSLLHSDGSVYETVGGFEDAGTGVTCHSTV